MCWDKKRNHKFVSKTSTSNWWHISGSNKAKICVTKSENKVIIMITSPGRCMQWKASITGFCLIVHVWRYELYVVISLIKLMQSQLKDNTGAYLTQKTTLALLQLLTSTHCLAQAVHYFDWILMTQTSIQPSIKRWLSKKKKDIKRLERKTQTRTFLSKIWFQDCS